MLVAISSHSAQICGPKPSVMSGERLSGEDRWREFSNSFKARSAAESSSEQSRSLSVRISTARRSVADDVPRL